MADASYAFWTIRRCSGVRLVVVATVAVAVLQVGGLAGCGGGGDDEPTGADANADAGRTTSTAAAAATTAASCEDTTVSDRQAVLCTVGDAPDQGLVVALHARGSSIEELRAVTELEHYAAEEGLAVVYPEVLDSAWGDDSFTTPSRPSGDEDIRFLDDLIASLRSDPRIDDGPVGVVGFSNGASMALRYAAQRPDDVRAVVAVAGELPRDPSIRPTQPVSLLEMYGTGDPIRSYDTGIADTPDRQPGQPTPTLSAPDTVAAFVAATPDASHEGPTESDPDPADGTRVRTERWIGGDGSVVVFRTIVDGGHTWPSAHTPLSGGDQYGLVSRDVDASAEAIAFILDPHGLR
jgi:polyhydroxybutyrate depolymerase